MPLSIIKGVLCDEEGVLAENGHRALAGRKVQEEEQVTGNLASRATPGWRPLHTFWDLEWVTWTEGNTMCCLHEAQREAINSCPRHLCRETQDREERRSLSTEGRKSMALVCVCNVSCLSFPFCDAMLAKTPEALWWEKPGE